MSWNECLYWYAQERGGTYYGQWPSGTFDRGDNGTLLLEDPKGPMVVYLKVTASGRYGLDQDVSVGTRVRLERPYTLRIKRQSALRGGVNTVLDGLERGAQMLGRKADLTPDYGAPEIADDRGIKTNEPEFTRWVLQSRELSELLDAWSDYKVWISPTGPGSQEHLVEARAALGTGNVGIDANLDPMDQYGRALELEAQRAFYRSSPFFRQLDALVDLAKAARDAVTAWPMPLQQP